MLRQGCSRLQAGGAQASQPVAQACLAPGAAGAAPAGCLGLQMRALPAKAELFLLPWSPAQLWLQGSPHLERMAGQGFRIRMHLQFSEDYLQDGAPKEGKKKKRKTRPPFGPHSEIKTVAPTSATFLASALASPDSILVKRSKKDK